MIAVRPSGIHGQGLFASQDISEGTVIGTLEGEFVTEDGDHVLWIDEARGFLVRNDMRFINHADAPNAAYYDDLTVVALRDIAAGEEITHDYDGGEDAEEPDRAWGHELAAEDEAGFCVASA